jgi:hypothetical protein
LPDGANDDDEILAAGDHPAFWLVDDAKDIEEPCRNFEALLLMSYTDS